MPAGVEFEGYVKSWRPPEMKQRWKATNNETRDLKGGGRDGR